MLKNNSPNKLQLIFFSFLLLLLFEGYYCKYSEQRINAKGSFCEKYLKNFWGESGFVETTQVVFIFIALILCIYQSINLKKIVEKFILYTICICLFYYLGEEISWGQHYLKFETPQFFKNVNNQKEFNLHNISNLFDQVPRSFVFVICGFSFFYVLIHKKLFKKELKYSYLILPNNNLSYISIILLIVSFPDFINDKFNLKLYDYFTNIWGTHLGNKIYELSTLNYIRLSELQELIFAFYFLNYMIALKYFYSVTRKIN